MEMDSKFLSSSVFTNHGDYDLVSNNQMQSILGKEGENK